MRSRIQPLLALFAPLVVASRAMSQSPLVSLQAGVTPFEGEQAFEMGVRLSPRGHLGVSVSADLYPRYVTLGALVGVADFALAGKLPFGTVAALELRAGPSVAGGVAPGGATAAPGYNAGVGLVFTIDSRTTLRADYTYRRLWVGAEAYRIPSLTAGFLVHH